MRMRHVVMLAMGLWGGLWSSTSAPRSIQASAGSDDGLLQRFLSRHEDPLTQYRAFRRLEAKNGRFEREGWIEARTDLKPGGKFDYEIMDAGGSEYIRHKVLEPFLANE